MRSIHNPKWFSLKMMNKLSASGAPLHLRQRERQLPKLNVAGSIPVSRSNWTDGERILFQPHRFA
jgi:hypothetical protein